MGTSEASHYGSLLFEKLLRAMMISVCPYGPDVVERSIR